MPRSRVTMGVFDIYLELLLKTTKDGVLLYYPWGIFGKGYVLPSAEKKLEILRFIRRYCLVSFLVAFPLGIIIAVTAEGMTTTAAVIYGVLLSLAMCVLLFWWWRANSALVQPLQVTTIRLTFADTFKTSHKLLDVRLWWGAEIVALLFAGLWLLMLIIGLTNPPDNLIGLTIIIFGLPIYFGFLIWLKRK